jgi:hypothetical protein
VSLLKYSEIVSAMALGSLGLLLLALRGAVQPEFLLAIALGASLAASNGVAAYALIRWSARRSNQVFFRAILGGMMARLALMLGVVAAAITFGGIPPVPLVASLLSYFVLFLVTEIVALGGKAPARAESR